MRFIVGDLLLFSPEIEFLPSIVFNSTIRNEKFINE